MGTGVGKRSFHARAPEGDGATIADEDLHERVQKSWLRRVHQRVHDLRRRNAGTRGGLLSSTALLIVKFFFTILIIL